MAKFLGAIFTLLAGLCLVGVIDVAAVRNLTSTEFLEDVAAKSLADPAASEEVVEETVAWLEDQPARQAALQAAFGDDWREPMRDATRLAIQTPQFETAYRDVFDQIERAEPGESVVVAVDLGPTVTAVSPQLDRDVVEAIDQLPSGFFIAGETIERDDLDELNDFRRDSRQVLIWLGLIGLAAVVIALGAFRSPLPLAWIGAVAVGVSLLQFLLVSAIGDDVAADQEDAIQRVGVEAVFESLIRTTTRPLVLIGIALIVVAIATDKTLKRLNTRGGTDDMPTGSDTDWADPTRSDGFPQIIS